MMTERKNLRVLLIGAPAVGKSSLVRSLKATGKTVSVATMDEYVLSISLEARMSGPLPDAIIDTATRALLSRPHTCDAELEITELPHHDYITLLETGLLVIDSYDFVVAMTAPLDTLLARNSARGGTVPEPYVGRCWGAIEGFLAWHARLGDRNIIRFDMEVFTPASAAAVLIDASRSQSSATLTKLTVIPDRDRPYLGGHLTDSVEWDDELVRKVVSTQNVKSALDVGCGTGMTIDFFEQLGVQCWGLEGNSGVLDGPSRRRERLLLCDFTKQWIQWPVPVDLVWCVEVLEHIPERFQLNVVQTIASSVGRLAFVTAAQPGQRGYHHVNCRPRDEWIDIFGESGLRIWPSGERLLKSLSDRGEWGPNFLKTNGMFLVRQRVDY